MMPASMTYLYVALGGAIGSCARYAITHFALRISPYFPVGTVAVNLLGSFLMGMLALAVARMALEQHPYWPLLAIGALGGFTTFSTFSLDFLQLMDKNGPGLALVYVLMSVIGSLLCVYAGWVVGRYVIS